MRIRIWPILLVGFGALITIIGLSGWLAYVRAKSTYTGISQLYEAEHQTQQSLTHIQVEIDKSAILLRDFMLDRKFKASDARSELEKMSAATREELTLLSRLVPPSQFSQLEKSKQQTTSYWHSLDPVLTTSPQGLRPDPSILQLEIFPHRQSALRVIGEVQRLSSEAFQTRKREIDSRNAGLAFYLGKIVGITVLIALVVAIVSALRMHALEQTADEQHRQVQEAEEGLRRLSQQLVRAQEEERRGLSRDLHDQVGQVLTALRMSLGNFEKSLNLPVGPPSRELDLAKRLAGQALRSTRDLAMGLRPTMLDDLGLEAALEWYGRQHGKLYGVPVSIHVQAPLDTLSDAQKTCIYRIVQEALNNAAKYADAQSVDVTLIADRDTVSLQISDDGKGFNPSGIAGRGLGLLGMRERIIELGGSLAIDSSPDGGTRIRADLPLSPVSV